MTLSEHTQKCFSDVAASLRSARQLLGEHFTRTRVLNMNSYGVYSLPQNSYSPTHDEHHTLGTLTSQYGHWRVHLAREVCLSAMILLCQFLFLHVYLLSPDEPLRHSDGSTGNCAGKSGKVPLALSAPCILREICANNHRTVRVAHSHIALQLRRVMVVSALARTRLVLEYDEEPSRNVWSVELLDLCDDLNDSIRNYRVGGSSSHLFLP